MKVAIYARISTDRQNYANQMGQLIEYCKNKGYTVLPEFIYEEEESGKFSEAKRPRFLQLLDDAAKHRFDAILVWALDRFTREGVAKTWQYIKQLDGWKVGFISYMEPFLNTTSENELVRDLMLSIMAIMAKQERIRISERTKASLDRAKREIAEKGFYITKAGKKIDVIGKKLSYSPEVLGQINDLRQTKDAKGKPITTYKIAKLLNLNPGQVDYAIKKLLPPIYEKAKEEQAAETPLV